MATPDLSPLTTAAMPLDLADDSGNPRTLTLGDVLRVARQGWAVDLLREQPAEFRSLERAMAASAEWVGQQAESVGALDSPPIYGINTGFGALAGRRTFRTRALADALSYNLLAGHAAGAGEPLPPDAVRATLLIRASQLARGRSGIRIAVVNRLLGALNAGIYPVVPSWGSLGASGDLAPLSHLALVIAAPPPAAPAHGAVWRAAEDGVAEHLTLDHGSGRPQPWRRVPAAEAMASAGGQIRLAAKEGLALINGATASAALAALTALDLANLLDHAELALAMTLEAARGFRDAFLPPVHQARPFAGAAEAAARVLQLVSGSTLLDPASADTDPVRVPPQDPYSIRCGPQVIGAARDALAWISQQVEIELNAAVDNPLVFLELPRTYKAVSGGNFHGAPLGYALDLAKIVLADLASQSERRTFKLTDYRFDDEARQALSLPRFLVADADNLEGFHSGFMIAQYTAASLVSAAKTLAHPDSVDSIPSSANQEDHVSMSMNAGLHARQIVAHAEAVIAIELLAAAQALDLRQGQGQPGAGTAAARSRLREAVPALYADRPLTPDVETLVYMLRRRELIGAAYDAAGIKG